MDTGPVFLSSQTDVTDLWDVAGNNGSVHKSRQWTTSEHNKHVWWPVKWVAEFIRVNGSENRKDGVRRQSGTETGETKPDWKATQDTAAKPQTERAERQILEHHAPLRVIRGVSRTFLLRVWHIPEFPLPPPVSLWCCRKASHGIYVTLNHSYSYIGFFHILSFNFIQRITSVGGYFGAYK